MAVDARLEAVEAENEMLRARIEQLEDIVGMRMPAPIVFGFTGSERRVFGILMKRDVATKDMMMHALYSGRPDECVEIKIVDVFVCKMRSKLKRYNVSIETVWGVGYRLKPETKDKVRSMMKDEGLAA